MQHAARAGQLLGLLFVIKYFFMMYSMEVPVLSLFFGIGTIAVPFVAYRLTRSYRDLLPADSPFPLSIAWAHGVFLYLFATLIVLIPHYYFYTSVFPEQIPVLEARMQEALTQAPQNRVFVEQLLGGQTIGEVLRSWLVSTSTFEKLWRDFSTNLFWGSIFSLINALILRRRG